MIYFVVIASDLPKAKIPRLARMPEADTGRSDVSNELVRRVVAGEIRMKRTPSIGLQME
jgi:hypothetical protein